MRTLQSFLPVLLLLVITAAFCPSAALAQSPQLSAVSPDTLTAGTQVTLTGSGFGATRGHGRVILRNARWVPVVSWSETQIVITVPAQTASGTAFVRQNGTWSNGVGYTVGTTGSAAEGTLSANAVSLGSVQIGDSGTQSATITNVGSAVVNITQASISGTGFTSSGLTLPLSLTAGESVTFKVVFTPSTSGQDSSILSVTSDASNPSLTIPLSGTGLTTGALSVTPTTANLGDVTIGTSKTMAGTLAASSSSVVVSSATSSTPEFSVTGMSFPATVAAGSSAPFSVQFTPNASGAASGKITFVTTASGSPSVTVAGTGMAAAQHSVDLNWSTSSSAVSYNVYRGSQSGGPYAKVNASPDASTTFTDDAVQAGQTYYYVTTAVGSDDVESAHSNQATAVVPSP